MRSSPVAPTPKRQSCDRCHDQKLRCTRSGNRKTGTCDRCLRKGSTCAYSSSLPKGRPSLYRLNETSEGPNDSGEPQNAPWTASGTSPARLECPAIQSALPISSATVGPDQQHGDSIPVFSDVDLDRYDDVDMDVQDDVLVLPGSKDSFAELWASWCPDDYLGSDMLGMVPSAGSALHLVQEAQSPAGVEFPGPLPQDILGVSAGNSISFSESSTLRDDSGRMNELVENSSMGSSSDASPAPVFAEESNNFKLSMTHLSQLSTQLSQLLGSSRSFLAENLEPAHQSGNQDAASQVKDGIESVFKFVNTWLVCGPKNTDTTPCIALGPTKPCDLLRHVFSASHQLLNILRQVRVDVGTNTPSPFATAIPFPEASSPISSGPHAEANPAELPNDAMQGSSVIVHHLVLVCVTLLMNIYLSILIALQRSADTLHYLSPERDRNLMEPNGITDAASRAHLQLVSVVQMCSYFIKRQNQILDVVLSGSNSEPMRTSPSQKYKTEQSIPPDHTSQLRSEVERRLRTLQKSLQIPS
ncbi:hypothetical protein HD806DRAFT_545902 [Xylariaceae sp. AK1471]|nr:hypothetical protein HD806DRAFT_545902 [Xylariaceae sp. AK1471]